jgi:hypothetical protein
MAKGHPQISMRRQSKLVGVARSTADYKPVAKDPEGIHIKRLADATYPRSRLFLVKFSRG